MDLGRFETSLDVKDIERSLAFYKALGFRQVDGGVDIRNVGLRKGDCRLSLYQGYLKPAETQLIFWQGNVEAIARDLASKGVRFDEGWPKKDKNGAAAMLKDPDGHPLYFINLPVHFYNQPGHERKSPAYRPTILRPDKRLGWFELSLDVQDIDRSVAFYLKLGFRVASRSDEGMSATLQKGDCRIALYQGILNPAWAKPGGRLTQLIFRQGDVERVARDLTRQGLNFERIKGKPGDGGAAVLLKDSDGHPIYLINMPGVVREEPSAAANRPRAKAPP